MKAKGLKLFARSITSIALCVCCVGVSTYALVSSSAEFSGNIFSTGEASINLNDGKEIITKDEFIFEPGATICKDFFIANDGSCDVYYKLYFSELSGGLENIVNVKITCGEALVYEGTPSELTRESVSAVDDILAVGDRRDFKISVTFPAASDNQAQNTALSFKLSADATQVKNNTDKEFD